MPAQIEPLQLLKLPLSAYHPALFRDGDVTYLLTTNFAYRLVQQQDPQRFPLDLGQGPTLTRSAFVFWSNGSVYSAPRAGGAPARACDYPHQPQFFVSSGEHFAWIDRSEAGAFSIHAAEGERSRRLGSFSGEIPAASMLGESVLFVESRGSTWKIGVAHRSGTVGYGDAHRGRAPSMLAVDRESIFYFDVDRLEIVKVSLDLQREESWVTGVVCSPIAVANETAYCGSVEGLFTVSRESPRPQLLVANARSLVTSIAADASSVAWLRDVGPDQLSVELLPVR